MSDVVVAPPVATPPAVVTTPAAATSAPAPSNWVDGLGDDLKGYVTTKGFKEPKDVVESYRNFEKLKGVPMERLLTLPESLEGDGMNSVWERLGAVKEAKELSIDVPKELADEKFSDFLKDTFHKLKVPRSMAETFTKEFINRQKSMMEADAADSKQAVATQFNDIKKEWGAAFEQNQNIANAAAAKFGLTMDEIKSLGASMGPAKALKFLHKIGEGLGEGTYVQGSDGRDGQMTPEQARSEIKSLIKDVDFGRRLAAKDSDSLKKWNRLHESAFRG